MLKDGRFYLVLGMWAAIIGYAIAGTYIYKAGKSDCHSEVAWTEWMKSCRGTCYEMVTTPRGYDLCEQDCQVKYWGTLNKED